MQLLSSINILRDNYSLFIHSSLAAVMALGLKGAGRWGTGGSAGRLTLRTLWSLELGSRPWRECVLEKTSRLGSYKPPLLPDICGCLAGLRLKACWVVQHTGPLHTSGSGVNPLSISSIKKACFLGSKTETP